MKSAFKITALHILTLLFCFWSFGSLAQVPKKMNVCTMTLNSSDEVNVFRQYLPENQFNFIELVSDYSVQREGGYQSWFTRACQRSDLSCDVLIISGHFAGMFFGKNSESILSLSELEKTACRKGCPRILGDLKEAFLFGCNTMAHKGKLYRTPEEYLEVLLELHQPRNTAEMVVAGRHSVLDFSYKEKMEHIFSKKTKIYGFTELSPLGFQARGVLHEFLRGIENEYGSYYNYLVRRFYQSSEPFFNSHFQKSFSKLSSVEQSYGMDQNHPEYLTFKRVCHLYQPDVSVASKMITVRDLFREQKGLQSFSAIKNFLIENRDQISERDFRNIQNINVARETFLSAYPKINSNLVYIKSVFLQFLNIMDWLPQEEYRVELTSTLLPVIQNMSLQSFQILESLFEHDQLNHEDIILNPESFTPDYLTNIWSVLALDFLNIDTPEARRSLMNYCLENLNSGEYLICYQVLKTLGHLGVDETDIYAHMVEFLNHEDYGMVYYALYGLAYSEVSYPRVHFEIVKKLYHENFWIRLQAIRTLDYLGLIEQQSDLRDILREISRTETDSRVVQELQRVLL